MSGVPASCSRSLARGLFALALFPLLASSGGGDESCSAKGEENCKKPQAFVPTKGVDLNHSGWSPSIGPFDITKPTWVFEEPSRDRKRWCVNTMAVFHSSPLIDADLNVYIQSTTGWAYSLDRRGRLRWSFMFSSCNPGNMALADGILYATAQDGFAYALEAATGREVWRRQVAHGFPDDTHSIVAVGETLLTACNTVGYATELHPIDSDGRPFTFRNVRFGNENVCALRTRDGTLKWNYSMWERATTFSYNQMQAVVGNTVIFSDTVGGSYRVNLEDGSEIWHSPPITSLLYNFWHKGGLPMGSTANMVVGPNDKLYHGFNIDANVGIIRVLDVHTGHEVWRRTFHEEVNAAPAVGKVYGRGDQLAVVVAVGNNVACEPLTFLEKLRVTLRLETKYERYGEIVALDAEDGRDIWSFDLPFHNDVCAGMNWTDTCCPDILGNPGIGGDGTVYINWSGGASFSLRDANADGVVQPQDPAEVSVYHHGFGSNGITAVAPGLTVFPNCRQLVAYAT